MGYCKDIANLLFWELWECLTIPMKIIVPVCSKLPCLSSCTNILFWIISTCLGTHALRRPLTFIRRQKIKFIIHVFLEILQRYGELIVLDTLGMPGFAYPKWCYQLVENFIFYLQAKNQLPPTPSSCFSGDIVRYANLLWDMPGYSHPKW